MTTYVLHNSKGRFCHLTIDAVKATSEWYALLYEKFEKEHGKESCLFELHRTNFPAQMAGGLYYEYDLCRDGMMVVFIAFPGTTPEQIRDAKNELRLNHDVVSISVIKLKKEVEFTPPQMEN